MMTNGDLRDGFFYLSLTRIMDYFSCSPLFLFIYLLIYVFYDTLPEVPEYAKMQFHIMTLHNNDVLGKIAWIR